jgi:hypothetical protein
MPDNNSFVRKDSNKRPNFDERKKDLVQYDNVKQVKKKSGNTTVEWLRAMFLSGRSLKDILLDVAENQIIPQIKDNFRNSLVSIIDLGIYKDHRSGSSSTTPSGSFITNYVQFSNNSSNTTQKKLEATKEDEKKLVENGYSVPAFRTKYEAEDFLRSIHAYLDKYDTLSVLELAWMQQRTVDYTWDKYGWDREELKKIKEVTHINNSETPWIVNLPKAHIIE